MGDVFIRIRADVAQAVLKLNQVADAEQKIASKAKISAYSMAELEAATGKVGETSQASGMQLSSMLGRTASLAGVAAGALKVTNMILREMKMEAREAAEGIKSAEVSLKSLAQISASGAELKGQKDLALALAAKEGLTREQANNLVFTAGSLGLRKDIGVLAGSVAFANDPNQVAQSVGKLQAAFGPEEAGGSRQVINKLLVAAKASDVSFDQFAGPALVAANSVAAIGGSDEELLASLSVLSPGFKSPDTAAQRINALANLFAQEDAKSLSGRPFGTKAPPKLGGKGLLAGVATLYELDESERAKVLAGNSEARAAYEAIVANRFTVGERFADISAANAVGSRDSFSTAVTIADQDQELKLRRDERRADALKQIATMDIGLKEMEQQVNVKMNDALSALGGAGPGSRAVDRIASRLQEEYLGYDTADKSSDPMHSSSRGRKVGRSIIADDSIQKMVDALERNTKATEQNSRVTGTSPDPDAHVE